MKKDNFYHRGTETQRSLISSFKSFCRSLWLLVSVVIFYFSASMALACPLCVDATPYKHGMLIAVFVLLPVPFLLAGGLFLWVRRMSKGENQPS